MLVYASDSESDSVAQKYTYARTSSLENLPFAPNSTFKFKSWPRMRTYKKTTDAIFGLTFINQIEPKPIFLAPNILESFEFFEQIMVELAEISWKCDN